MKTIIYDFGTNNGDDIPYYLMKSDLVVAVEANSRLCEEVRERFHKAIDEGRLIVENCVIADSPSVNEVPFFLHKSNALRSQFPEPDADEIGDFNRILVRSRTPSEIICEHGAPHYVKIDLENYDATVLRHLFEANIYPNYISSEVHSFEVIAAIASCRKYTAFKMIEGSNVPFTYRNALIKTLSGGKLKYSFPPHSSGPFGDDIKGGWMSFREIFRKLGLYGLGWKDVHATRLDKEKGNWSLKRELLNLVFLRVSLKIDKVFKFLK